MVDEIHSIERGTKSSTETVVVIPTRNRADLAMNALRSVLEQPVDDLHLIVSDNSTIKGDRSALEAFCQQISDPRLLYIEPPTPLSMTEHWDWAMREALHRFDASHFLYLTDRSVFKPGVLRDIVKFANQYPDKVISYDWVTIFDHLSPIIVERQPQTGQLVEVPASRLLFSSSRAIFPRCLPRMMNCCAPRSIIEKVQKRFGSVFASTAPDYNFCYRCLEIVDDILYYDCAAYVSYALTKSNGAGAIGLKTEGAVDFASNLNLGGRRRNYATPLPALETEINWIMHEYCVVQGETASGKFPKVHLAHYAIRNIESLLTVLAYKLPLSVLGVLVSLRTRMRKILRLQWPMIADYERSPEFESVADAIHYATSVPFNNEMTARHLDLLNG